MSKPTWELLPPDDPRIKRQTLGKRALCECFVGTLDGEPFWSDAYYMERGPLPANAALKDPAKAPFAVARASLGIGDGTEWERVTPAPETYRHETGRTYAMLLRDAAGVPCEAMQASYVRRVVRLGDAITFRRYRQRRDGPLPPVAAFAGETLVACLMPLHWTVVHAIERAMKQAERTVA